MAFKIQVVMRWGIYVTLLLLMLCCTANSLYAQNERILKKGDALMVKNENEEAVKKEITAGTVVIVKTYKNCAYCFTELDDYINQELADDTLRKYYGVTIIEKRADPIWSVRENEKLMKHLPAHYFACYSSKVSDTACLMPQLYISHETVTPMVLLSDGKVLFIYAYKDLFDDDGQLRQTFKNKLKAVIDKQHT